MELSEPIDPFSSGQSVEHARIHMPQKLIGGSGGCRLRSSRLDAFRAKRRQDCDGTQQCLRGLKRSWDLPTDRISEGIGWLLFPCDWLSESSNRVPALPILCRPQR